ncbi:MAG TPA: prepilin-type N-terminal cleavage/methylation domain-containing protein [bacterium]|nr:prepilin-type N-terminal cleavage/methylation domain-containing protein [bacterium]
MKQRPPFREKAAKGLTLLEVVVVLFIFALLLIPTLTVVHRCQQSFALENATRQVLAALEMARAAALNERREFQVVFSESSFAIYRLGKERIEKIYKLPEHVLIAEKTEGFDPVIFRPDGTCSQAGHLILRHERTGQEQKLVLYNLTGKCLRR